MDTKASNRLPLNLPHLQSCIKKDPSAYQEEYQLQYRHYESVMQIFMFNPSYFDKEFETLVIFLAQTAPFYKNNVEKFSQQLINLLTNYSTSLHRASRLACCKALVILRFKSLINLTDVLPLFFELSKCKDKALRSYIRQNIITDIKNMNKKSRDEKKNKEIQRFMFAMIANEQQEVSAKLALDIMIELYKKNVWRNKDLVNQIANKCLSRSTKILVTSVQFFLGTDEVDLDEKDSSDEEEERREAITQLKDKLMANKFNKNTRKRQKLLDKVKKTVRTAENREKKDHHIDFSAMHLINDPQDLAEKLLAHVESTSERFDVKLLIINLISRLIGIHDLILLNFYPTLTRYIQPHQTDVTRVLQYAAQSVHNGVPPNEIEPMLRAIVNNFVSDRNSTEAITVGLNAVREVCARNPLVMDKDLLQDLIQYIKYKNKNVSIAAKSLIALYRVKNPELLRKKDRGRPIAATEKYRAKEFGESKAVYLSDEDSDKMDIDSGSEDDSEDNDISSYASEESLQSEEEEEEQEDEDGIAEVGDKVRLEDIERIYKRPKHNKESRLATVLEGREGREKYGSRKPKINAKSSSSNRDKKRNHAFGMIKHKIKRHKRKKTFHEKQLDMKQKLLNMERSKRK